jgi:hypothetical protein
MNTTDIMNNFFQCLLLLFSSKNVIILSIFQNDQNMQKVIFLFALCGCETWILTVRL